MEAERLFSFVDPITRNRALSEKVYREALINDEGLEEKEKIKRVIRRAIELAQGRTKKGNKE